jgi:ferredoxin
MAEATTVVVDRERCMGSGMCVVYAPGTFTHDEQARAIVLDQVTDPVDVIEAALEACPTSALRLVPEGTEA